jgi:ABC-type Fe3+ transport system substrate-binding protein
MSNLYFKSTDTLYDITEKYKDTIDVIASIGMEQLKDENMRKTLGKSITLETLLQTKKINIVSFEEKLVEVIEAGGFKLERDKNQKEIKLAGVLPCPVRMPLLDSFEEWVDAQTFDYNLTYELKAASMGVDWLTDSLQNGNIDDLPDLFISAGFDMFFDKKLFGKYKTADMFEDYSGLESYNVDFHNDEVELKDPDGQYAMLGVVPAVFLINTEELGDLPVPQSWEDVLKEEFAGRVSLPIADFDLFNAMLLNIYKKYGEEGVAKLGKSLQASMHPSEMVKSHRKKVRPIVTVMPYFFTRTVKKGGPMIAVWPEDGAIISPIFMLSKKEKKEELKPIVEYFSSKPVGEILAHNGKFPSINAEVDNRVPQKNKYMWIGWDFLKENDITELINKCEAIFNQNVSADSMSK